LYGKNMKIAHDDKISKLNISRGRLRVGSNFFFVE
jgi:hypothetical protein